MAEHDYDVANALGSDFRADVNAALEAIRSQNSKASDPTTMFAHMLHMDTTSALLKQRDASNAAWKQVGIFKNLSKSIAGSSTTTLTDTEAAHGVIELTGAVTGNKSVEFPASVPGLWLIRNASTGDYAVTLKPTGGTGVDLQLGARSILVIYSDGSTIRELTKPQLAVGSVDIDLSASGAQAVSGIGFRFRAALFFGAVTAPAVGKMSIGASAGATYRCIADNSNSTADTWYSGAGAQTSYYARDDGTKQAYGYITATSDGFSIDRHTSAGASGTFTLSYILFA